MKKEIIRITKDLRLRSRFAARKLGMHGYDIHQIRLTMQKLIYVPIPKNASTTIKQALHTIQFGRPFDTNRPVNDLYVDIHDYYMKKSDAFISASELKEATTYTRFAVVRDPVERLISCYRNRVVDLGDLQADATTLQKMDLPVEPDLNTFVLNLKKYRKASKNIEHHSRPQSAFLGGSTRNLDHIYPIEKIDRLFDLLRSILPGLKIPNKKSEGIKISHDVLSQQARKYAIRFYEKDCRLLSNYYQSQE